MAEESLTTKVHVLSSNGAPARGSAKLDLRGNALLIHDVRENRLVTRCLSTVGATRELRPYIRYHLLRYGLGAFALFLLIWGPVSARFGVEVGSSLFLALLEFLVVAVGLWFVLPYFSSPAVAYRFNTEEGVFEFTIKDDRAKNPALTALTEHFLPFEREYHRYAFEESIYFFSDRGYSVPFIQKVEPLLGYLMVPLSFAVAVMTGLDFQRHSMTIAILCYCIAPFLAANMYYIARTPPVVFTPKPFPHELRTNRSALKLLIRGETAGALEILHDFLEESPEASHTRRLLAQVYVGLTQYDDALALFQMPQDSGVQEWADKIERVKRMTAGIA